MKQVETSNFKAKDQGLRLDMPLQYLKGVGPQLGSLLGRRGLRTVNDLLRYYPRSYEDRRAARDIASLQAGDLVSVRARVVKVSSYSLGRSPRKIYDVVVGDHSGQNSLQIFSCSLQRLF